MADRTVPLSWVLVFLLFALGIGVLAIGFMGGNVIPTAPALV